MASTNKRHVLLGVAVLVVAAGFALGLQSISDEGGYAGLSPRFVPTVVAFGLALCGVGLVFQGLRSGGDANGVVLVDEAAGQTPQWKGLAWLLGGLSLHTLLIGTLGFVLSSTLLLVCVARGYGSKRLLRDAAVGLVLTLPMWALFSKVLGLNLPLLPALGF